MVCILLLHVLCLWCLAVSKDSLESADSDMDSDQHCEDESIQNEAVDNSDVADTVPTVQNDDVLNHCDSAVAVV